MTLNPHVLISVWCLFTLLAPASALAVSPVFWNTSSFMEFSKGSLKGISLGADGQLTLAPKFDSVFDSDQALIWSAVYDNKKNLYVGTGHDGKVFKIDSSGSSSLFFDAAELDVLALALDSEQNLYAATSPDGSVYKISADGKSTAFFDPDDKFIWDLVFDRKGQLFVATGNKGKIYKVNKDGKGEILYDSGQSNLVSVAVDDAGNLIVGSEPDGYVYRIAPDGKVFVLFDSSMREIHAIQLDSKGNIYLVAVNGGSAGSSEKASAPESASSDSVTVSLSLSGSSDNTRSSVAQDLTVPKVAARRLAKSSGEIKSAILRIAPDNSVQTLWTSDSEAAFGLYVRPDGSLLFSTGEKGRIYLLKPDKKLSLLIETTEEQTTKLIPAGPDVFACTSNLAKIYRLGGALNPQGSYESEVKDTQAVSLWGSIHWDAILPSGTATKLQTRSGNTKKPDSTWSDWSKVYSRGDGESIESPRARYIQYRIELVANGQTSPILDQVSIPYLQQNLAPEVKSIKILPVGVALQRLAGLSSQRLKTSVVDQGSAEASGADEAIPQVPSVSAPLRRVFQKGALSFTWDAEDDNGDDLSYAVYFKGDQEVEWRLIEEDIEDRFYTLDADTLPDGKYLLKVLASDRPSNPQGMAMSGELISPLFHVDNTPPQVQLMSANVQSRSATVRFKVTDITSSLRKGEYSLDGQNWEIVFSVDGIVDSKNEEFEVKLGNLDLGEHVLALRIYDSAGNVAIGKATVHVK